METPHIPQYQTSFSHSHSDISENSANIPMAPISTPSTSTGFGSPSTLTITHNHKNQHTNDTPIIGEAPTQSNNNWGQSNPQEGKIQHEETPHIPQHRIGLSHLHPGISKSSANIPIAPISTPSTSTEFGSPSTLRITTPRRTKGNRSPIRFPTPEADKLPTSSSLGWDSSNSSLHLNTPLVNPNKTTKPNPHDPKVNERNVQSEPMTVDHLPRRSYSHNITDSSSHKRGAKSLSLLLDNRHQIHQQNKRHHAETEVDKFATGMAKNIKQIIANVQQNIRNKPNPSTKRTRRHDSKGVSNFHLDQNDQIIRTYAGHPRCNYCFVASHPRTRCKFRKQDLQNGIDRAVHPEKGLLSYKDARNTYTPEPPVATLEQLPNEILEKICEYLTFEERCKFGATNRRIQFILTADRFWHKISIPNHLLKYELINKVVNMGMQSLSIPWSSIDREWTEYRRSPHFVIFRSKE